MAADKRFENCECFAFAWLTRLRLEAASIVDTVDVDCIRAAELQSIGQEVGIPAEQITRAALSLSPSEAKPTQRFLGMTTGVG